MADKKAPSIPPKARAPRQSKAPAPRNTIEVEMAWLVPPLPSISELATPKHRGKGPPPLPPLAEKPARKPRSPIIPREDDD